MVQCQNNLKQLSLAMLGFEQKTGHLPSGGWGCNRVGDPDRGTDIEQPVLGLCDLAALGAIVSLPTRQRWQCERLHDHGAEGRRHRAADSDAAGDDELPTRRLGDRVCRRSGLAARLRRQRAPYALQLRPRTDVCPEPTMRRAPATSSRAGTWSAPGPWRERRR